MLTLYPPRYFLSPSQASTPKQGRQHSQVQKDIGGQTEELSYRLGIKLS